MSKNDKSQGKLNEVSEYLIAPKRKRTLHVVLAFAAGLDEEIDHGIVRYLKKDHQNLKILRPKSLMDLVKSFSKQVSLLIIDDEFDDLISILKAIRSLKKIRSKDAIPVLFLTENTQRLIKAYNFVLSIYQEVDEYIYYRNLDINIILNRINFILSKSSRRRSRRYPVTIYLNFFHLQKDATFKGELIDLSFHGGLIKTDDSLVFQVYDQVKIYLPSLGLLEPKFGDFMRLSARIKRVLICGNIAGFAFEYLSDKQEELLISFLIKIINKQISRENRASQ